MSWNNWKKGHLFFCGNVPHIVGFCKMCLNDSKTRLTQAFAKSFCEVSCASQDDEVWGESCGCNLKGQAHSGKAYCNHAPSTRVFIKHPWQATSYLPTKACICTKVLCVSGSPPRLVLEDKGEQVKMVCISPLVTLVACLMYFQIRCAISQRLQIFAEAWGLAESLMQMSQRALQLGGQEPHQEPSKGSNPILGDPLDSGTGSHSGGGGAAQVEGLQEAAGGQWATHPPCDVSGQTPHLVLQIVLSDRLWKALGKQKVCNHEKEGVRAASCNQLGYIMILIK